MTMKRYRSIACSLDYKLKGFLSLSANLGDAFGCLFTRFVRIKTCPKSTKKTNDIIPKKNKTSGN